MINLGGEVDLGEQQRNLFQTARKANQTVKKVTFSINAEPFLLYYTFFPLSPAVRASWS
jgi:hypothetical protein